MTICMSCKKKRKPSSMVIISALVSNVVELIKNRNPHLKETDEVCNVCVDDYRSMYLEKIIEDEKGKLSILEKNVIESIKEEELISENINNEVELKSTFGDRIADKVAEFGGSWSFIILFASFLMVWMIINVVWLGNKAFDPFPFILLNLVLSCVTAMQAPIIMMSQNRQGEKDRLKAELEYQINLKAELQTRQIIKKLDSYMTYQWKKMIEIQEMNIKKESSQK